MKKASRFSRNVSSSVAPPTQHGAGSSAGAPRDYFAEDDEEDNRGGGASSLYNSTDNALAAAGADTIDDSDEVDPLDAFMAGIDKQVEKEKTSTTVSPRPEIVSEVDVEDFEGYIQHAPTEGIGAEGDEDSYLEVGSGKLRPDQKTMIEPLAPVNHSTIDYKSFRKAFYTEHSDITAMSQDDVMNYREELEVQVSRPDAPRPIRNFDQAGFDSTLLKEIHNCGYETPTAIQAQAIPIALSGKDLIGLAKTGSGKTFAYVWPMIVHVLDQPQMQLGEGPIGLVLVPTRELASQIYTETKRFAKAYNIRTCVIYGGGGKWEMAKALKEAPEIVIATPGRFTEMVRMKATNLTRCTMVVLDEADRMFEMGFEYQMRSIVNNVRPDRQMLMFSATMKKKIEGFAREMLSKDEVRIVVGTIGQANPDIRQVAMILPNDTEKWVWLSSNIDEFCADGKVLIFVLSKAGTEEVAERLRKYLQARQLDVGVECLHGDKDQKERNSIMHRFGKNSSSDKGVTVLVATDIASRGLDVRDIRTVVNYDTAKNIETYVHRIGRTGRMGIEGVTPGTAYTLILPKESSFAVDLVQNLNLSHQPVSPELQALAQSSPKWGRIKHIPSGGYAAHGKAAAALGKGGHSTAGLGAAPAGASVIGLGRSSVALTSSMAAAATTAAGNSGMGGGPGRGRGRSGGIELSTTTGNVLSLPPGLQRSFVSGSSSGNGSSSICNTQQGQGMASGDYTANPYVEGHGQGRGKHLTQPAWMKDASGTATKTIDTVAAAGSTSNCGKSAISEVTSFPPPPPLPPLPTATATTGAASGIVASHPSTSIVPAKRKSRFGAPANQNPPLAVRQKPHLGIDAATTTTAADTQCSINNNNSKGNSNSGHTNPSRVLHGFVRASNPTT